MSDDEKPSQAWDKVFPGVEKALEVAEVAASVGDSFDGERLQRNINILAGLVSDDKFDTVDNFQTRFDALAEKSQEAEQKNAKEWLGFIQNVAQGIKSLNTAINDALKPESDVDQSLYTTLIAAYDEISITLNEVQSDLTINSMEDLSPDNISRNETKLDSVGLYMSQLANSVTRLDRVKAKVTNVVVAEEGAATEIKPTETNLTPKEIFYKKIEKKIEGLNQRLDNLFDEKEDLKKPVSRRVFDRLNSSIDGIYESIEDESLYVDKHEGFYEQLGKIEKKLEKVVVEEAPRKKENHHKTLKPLKDLLSKLNAMVVEAEAGKIDFDPNARFNSTGGDARNAQQLLAALIRPVGILIVNLQRDNAKILEADGYEKDLLEPAKKMQTQLQDIARVRKEAEETKLFDDWKSDLETKHPEFTALKTAFAIPDPVAGADPQPVIDAIKPALEAAKTAVAGEKYEGMYKKHLDDEYFGKGDEKLKELESKKKKFDSNAEMNKYNGRPEIIDLRKAVDDVFKAKKETHSYDNLKKLDLALKIAINEAEGLEALSADNFVGEVKRETLSLKRRITEATKRIDRLLNPPVESMTFAEVTEAVKRLAVDPFRWSEKKNPQMAGIPERNRKLITRFISECYTPIDNNSTLREEIKQKLRASLLEDGIDESDVDAELEKMPNKLKIEVELGHRDADRLYQKYSVQIDQIQSELQTEHVKASVDRKGLFDQIAAKTLTKRDIAIASTYHPRWGKEVRNIQEFSVKQVALKSGEKVVSRQRVKRLLTQHELDHYEEEGITTETHKTVFLPLGRNGRVIPRFLKPSDQLVRIEDYLLLEGERPEDGEKIKYRFINDLAYGNIIGEKGRNLLNDQIERNFSRDHDEARKLASDTYIGFTMLDASFRELQKRTGTRGHNGGSDDDDHSFYQDPLATWVHNIQRYGGNPDDWRGWIAGFFYPILPVNGRYGAEGLEESTHKLIEKQMMIRKSMNMYFDINGLAGSIDLPGFCSGELFPSTWTMTLLQEGETLFVGNELIDHNDNVLAIRLREKLENGSDQLDGISPVVRRSIEDGEYVSLDNLLGPITLLRGWVNAGGIEDDDKDRFVDSLDRILDSLEYGNIRTLDDTSTLIGEIRRESIGFDEELDVNDSVADILELIAEIRVSDSIDIDRLIDPITHRVIAVKTNEGYVDPITGDGVKLRSGVKIGPKGERHDPLDLYEVAESGMKNIMKLIMEATGGKLTYDQIMSQADEDAGKSGGLLSRILKEFGKLKMFSSRMDEVLTPFLSFFIFSLFTSYESKDKAARARLFVDIKKELEASAEKGGGGLKRFDKQIQEVIDMMRGDGSYNDTIYVDGKKQKILMSQNLKTPEYYRDAKRKDYVAALWHEKEGGAPFPMVYPKSNRFIRLLPGPKSASQQVYENWLSWSPEHPVERPCGRSGSLVQPKEHKKDS